MGKNMKLHEEIKRKIKKKKKRKKKGFSWSPQPPSRNEDDQTF